MIAYKYVFCLGMLLLPALVFAQVKPEKLLITNSDIWPPYSFINEQGQPDGLLIDLWAEFGRQNEIEIEFELTNWPKSLDLVRHNQVDVHAGLFVSDVRRQYMDFSSAIQIPLVTRVFVSQELEINSIDELASVRVAVTKGGFTQAYLQQHHPEIKLDLYLNSVESMQAALSGKVSAFILDYPAAMYYMHKYGSPEQFKVVGTLYHEALKVAVPKGDTQLLKYIDSRLAAMPRDVFDRIINKWMIPESRVPTWFVPSMIGGMTALVALFIVTYILLLRRQVHSRTQELEHISKTDSLTGLNNRKKIEELFISELYCYQKYKRPLSVILIDIDNFKQINDSFGHLNGDKVLVELAKLLAFNLRELDSLGRWGGEEFMLVCPETNLVQGKKLAEKLRCIIESHDFKLESQTCTASFGVTQVQLGDGIDDVFRRADSALYASKHKGRNAVSYC